MLAAGGVFLIRSSSTLTILDKLNDQFHLQNQKTRPLALKDVQKVIVYKDAEITLWKNCDDHFQLASSRTLIRSREEYDIHKKVSHIPFLIQSLMQTEEGKSQLEKVKHDLEKILDENKLSVAHQTVIKKSKEFLITGKDFEKYIISVRALLERSCKRAAEIHWEALQELSKTWDNLHQLQWDKTRIVVVGPPGPRNGFLNMQHWKQLYKEAGIKKPMNMWLYYFESQPGQVVDIKTDVIEKFLATWEANKMFGQSFRNDPRAMGKDILGKYAKTKKCRLFSAKEARKKISDLREQHCPYHKI